LFSLPQDPGSHDPFFFIVGLGRSFPPPPPSNPLSLVFCPIPFEKTFSLSKTSFFPPPETPHFGSAAPDPPLAFRHSPGQWTCFQTPKTNLSHPLFCSTRTTRTPRSDTLILPPSVFPLPYQWPPSKGVRNSAPRELPTCTTSSQPPSLDPPPSLVQTTLRNFFG